MNHLDILVGACVAALTIARARRLPALRPAAVAMGTWIALDVARLVGLPPRIDVAVFVAMPALWMALLISWRALPVLVGLLYALALLTARHAPAIVAHWTALLQAPRVAGFALALWVGLRSRRAPRDPGRDVGLVLALGGGVAVAAGLWPTWGAVQVVSLVAWSLVAGIVVVARPTR